MRHFYQGMAAVLLSSALAGCGERKTVENRLSAEELAWQPYRAGQVLRFGQDKSSKVRTYVVGDVNDELMEYSRGGNAPVFLGLPTRYRIQTISVGAGRTDTVRYVRTSVSTIAKPDSGLYTGGYELLRFRAADDIDSSPPAYLGWDIGFSSNFPLKEVAAGRVPADTAQQLLPALRLGGIEYGLVLRLANQLATPTGPYVSFPRNKPARRVYYAKGVGVVGFVEGTTLWYRLP